MKSCVMKTLFFLTPGALATQLTFFSDTFYS